MTRNRRWLALLCGVLLLAGVPLAVLATIGGGGSPLDEQASLHRDTPVTTTSGVFQDVTGLSGLTVCARGEVSVTMSVAIVGAPATFQVQVDQGPAAEPGTATFDPSAGTTSFSFTFVRVVQTTEGSDAHTFDLQWRTGGSGTTMTRGNVNALFGTGKHGPECGEEPPGLPDVVLILTDDQRYDTLWAMPTVRARLVDQGVTFSNAFVVNPTCCPSRATTFTGQYSHNTGVYKNTPPFGGFPSFEDDSTVATWLDDAGYRTALIGKYLNQYDGAEAEYIPPGWDRWVAFLTDKGNGRYFDYNLSVDGEVVHFGDGASDYSTDVLAQEAVAFIEGTQTSEPLFLTFTPKAPHKPYTPAPRHEDEFSDLPPWRPPSYNEADVDDKPPHVRNRPKLTAQQKADLDEAIRDQYRTLLAVDEAVADILDALQASGRLSNTLIVFASDNGYLWGEHRLTEKDHPYEESIRAPMVIRFDPLVSSPGTDDHLVLNMDLAPTFAEVAGVPSPGADGRSLLPLVAGDPVEWRSDFLIEHLRSGIPTYCAVRAEAYTYVRYLTEPVTGEELYDLDADPYQLVNRAEDADYADILSALRVRLGQLCDPPPPQLPG